MLRPPKSTFDVRHLQCNGFLTLLYFLKQCSLICDLHVDHIIQIALDLTDRERVNKLMNSKPKKQKYGLGSQRSVRLLQPKLSICQEPIEASPFSQDQELRERSQAAWQ